MHVIQWPPKTCDILMDLDCTRHSAISPGEGTQSLNCENLYPDHVWLTPSCEMVASVIFSIISGDCTSKMQKSLVNYDLSFFLQLLKVQKMWKKKKSADRRSRRKRPHCRSGCLTGKKWYYICHQWVQNQGNMDKLWWHMDCPEKAVLRSIFAMFLYKW